MQESTLALARKCEQFDPDGMTVYLFSGKFRRFDDVTSDKVAQIFMENDPAGYYKFSRCSSKMLQIIILNEKQQVKLKPNGETIVVVTDGET